MKNWNLTTLEYNKELKKKLVQTLRIDVCIQWEKIYYTKSSNEPFCTTPNVATWECLPLNKKEVNAR